MDELTLTRIFFSYPDSAQPLFRDFTYRFHRGWTCIAGANGCGKSTLLQIACGMILPDNGNIALLPQASQGVYCPQRTETFPEEIYSCFWNGGSETGKIFSLLRIREGQIERWQTLSGGEKKRMQIACALAQETQLLALDEPTNHLDADSSRFILEALRQFDGIGLLVTHDRTLADSLAHTTLFLEKDEDGIKIQPYSGGLSAALEQRNRRMQSLLAERSLLQSKIKKEQALSRKWAQEAAAGRQRMSKKIFLQKTMTQRQR